MCRCQLQLRNGFYRKETVLHSHFPASSPKKQGTREHGERRVRYCVNIKNLEKGGMNQRESYSTDGKHHKEHLCWSSRGCSRVSKLRKQFDVEKWQHMNVICAISIMANHTTVKMSSCTYSSARRGYLCFMCSF